jgi:hypothetical protein
MTLIRKLWLDDDRPLLYKLGGNALPPCQQLPAVRLAITQLGGSAIAQFSRTAKPTNPDQQRNAYPDVVFQD